MRFPAAGYVFAALAAACAGRASAVTVTRADGGWKNVTAADAWDPAGVPSAGNDYVVPMGTTVQSGDGRTEDIAFLGDSLTFGDANGAGSFIWRTVGSLSVPNVIVIAQNGSVNFGSSAEIPKRTRVMELRAPIQMLSTRSAPQWKTRYRSNGQHIRFTGAVVGDDRTGFYFDANEWSNNNTNNLAVFTGDLSAYHGYFQIADACPTLATNGFVTLAFGTTTCPGSVRLKGGRKTFVRTATPDDVFSVARLDMDAETALYPEIDLLNGRCGTIKVTGAFTSGGRHTVCARFLQEFLNVDHMQVLKFALLTVPAAAGTLNAADFTLVPIQAGELPPNALSLSIEDDANGDPTLYLTIAAHAGKALLTTSGKYGAENLSGFLAAHADCWTPVGAPTAGRDYLVCDDRQLYTPYCPPAGNASECPPGTNLVFGGDSLTLGDRSSVGYLYNQSYARVCIPKIVVVNGVYGGRGEWQGNRHSYLDAEITVLATEFEKAHVKTSATWQHIYLEGALIGAADSRLWLENCHGTAMDMGISGDCNRFFGTLKASSRIGGVTPNVWIGTTNIPGRVVLGGDVPTANYSLTLHATNGLSVGGFTVNVPTSFALSSDAVTKQTKPLVVKETLALNQTLSISPPPDWDVFASKSLTNGFATTVLMVRKTAVSDTSWTNRVVLSAGCMIGRTPAVAWELTFKETGSAYYEVGCRLNPYRYLVHADDTALSAPVVVDGQSYTKGPRTSFDEAWSAKDGDNAGRLPGWGWNVNERPSPMFDYYAQSTFRSHSARAYQLFRGRRLYLESQLIHQSNHLTVSNLVMIGGGISHVHAGGAANVYAGTPWSHILSTRTVDGRILVAKQSSFYAPGLNTTNCLRVASDISGPADLTVCKNGNGSSACYFEFCGDNTWFTGVLKLMDGAGSAATESKRMGVLFSDSDDLGGEPASFVFGQLRIQDLATLCPRTSFTYARTNRGLLVDGRGGLEVVGTNVFTLAAPLTMNGSLYKFGTGTAYFQSSVGFLSSDGGARSADPIEGRTDKLLVRAGSVGVTGSATALDGVTLEMSADASLRVKVDDAVAAGEGLKNAKTATPFVLANDTLPVCFDLGEFNGPEKTVAICTLQTQAAVDLAGKIVFTHPHDYFVERLPSVTNGGLTTIRVSVKMSGMLIIFR